jgi:bifunctional non-homologous end joining protein LigD
VGYFDGRTLKLESRNFADITGRYPELAGLNEALAGHTAVLDGEVVAIDGKGRPNFQLLQTRMHVGSREDAARRAKTTPVVYMIFDLMYLDGESLIDVPYEQRRHRLMDLNLSGKHWLTPPHQIGKGKQMLAAARKLDLEGLIAKRLGSLYRPGVRSDEWQKVKLLKRQEMVVGGYIPVLQQVNADVGALLLGYYENGVFRYGGSVGTGFTDADRKAIKKMLDKRRITKNPFDRKPGKPGAIFVEPWVVVEVEYTEWTADGALRHPSFKGLRDDKDAKDVTREVLPEV